jgi:hypothetical protein
MPILTPSYLPPPATTAFPSPSCTSSNGTCPGLGPGAATRPCTRLTPTPTSPEQEAVTQRLDVPLTRKRTLKIPLVKLETPSIQEDMAATLAVALLGHVLFLKSQVPLCAAPLLIPHGLLNNQLSFFLPLHLVPLHS